MNPYRPPPYGYRPPPYPYRQPPPPHDPQFGGGFSPKTLAVTGAISFGLAKMLGASVPGALIMGFGNMLWEAGSGNIPTGWHRWVLGLFHKPDA